MCSAYLVFKGSLTGKQAPFSLLPTLSQSLLFLFRKNTAPVCSGERDSRWTLVYQVSACSICQKWGYERVLSAMNSELWSETSRIGKHILHRVACTPSVWILSVGYRYH